MQHQGVASDFPCPSWYAHMQAAKYLGVDPERLLQMPVWWRDRALIAMTAEGEADRIIKDMRLGGR